MPKDTREVNRGVRLPSVRNKEGKITERARTVTDVDEVEKLDSATRTRLEERGAVVGFGAPAYGTRGTALEESGTGEAGTKSETSEKAASKKGK